MNLLLPGGGNSLIHVDFTIGSDKMDVIGQGKDGSSESIMHNGEWAFDI
jgi:aminopeptidase